MGARDVGDDARVPERGLAVDLVVILRLIVRGEADDEVARSAEEAAHSKYQL